MGCLNDSTKENKIKQQTAVDQKSHQGAYATPSEPQQHPARVWKGVSKPAEFESAQKPSDSSNEETLAALRQVQVANGQEVEPVNHKIFMENGNVAVDGPKAVTAEDKVKAASAYCDELMAKGIEVSDDMIHGFWNKNFPSNCGKDSHR